MFDAIYESIKEWLLWLARVPPEPEDPMGDVASLRVFQASSAYLSYRTLAWGLKQCAGLAIFLAVFVGLLVEARHAGPAMLWAIFGEFLAGSAFLVQAAVSFFMLRLDYEMRWYKVSDRSLRVREGVMAVHELTLTFANVQNVTITQGPIQRLFGISDVRVETAGGGGMSAEASPGHDQSGRLNLHEGVFRGVDAQEAEAIRDLVMDRIKRQRDGGLGDPDDDRAAPVIADVRRLELFQDLRREAAALACAARGLENTST